MGDVVTTANFFVTACGGEGPGLNFLESVIKQIKSAKRTADAQLVENPYKMARSSIDNTQMLGNYVNDSTDDSMTTLAMQIPSDKLLISYIIGKGGATLNEIESRTGTKIKIDRSQQGNPSHRVVFFVGSIKNVLRAFQQVTEIVDTRQNMEAESTVIEIPNDFVSRLIGRSGAVVKKLEIDTTTKIYIQQERDMLASQEAVFGRALTIRGVCGARMFAIYNILRMVCLMYVFCDVTKLYD